jgi:hypothetical protein
VDTHLILAQIIGKVGHHDLGLGRNTIFRGTTLLLRTGSTGLTTLLASLSGSGLILVDLSQRSGLTGSLGTLSGLAILRLGLSMRLDDKIKGLRLDGDLRNGHHDPSDLHGRGHGREHDPGHRPACGPRYR